MKPLTIEQLKALEVGDWVWIVESKENDKGHYESILCSSKFLNHHDYEKYRKTWFAWKNKEQVEIVDGAVAGKCRYVKNGKCTNSSAEAIDCPTEVYDKYSCYSDCDWFEAEYPQTEAKGEIVELPCKVGDTVWVVYQDISTLENYIKESIAVEFIVMAGYIGIHVPKLYGNYQEVYATREEAEARLAELKGGK